MAKRDGWKAGLEPARLADTGGVSGGVGVLARPSLNSAIVSAELYGTCDMPNGRLTGVTEAGFLLISLYMVSSDATRCSNIHPLGEAAWFIGRGNQAFVVAGDFQILPF